MNLYTLAPQRSCLTLTALLILLVFPASPGWSATVPATPALSPAALKSEFDSLIVRELHPYSNAAIKVVSLRSGLTVYESSPYLLMPPASVQKLFTAAAVLARLGPEHTIETYLAIHPDTNTLYLKGCGDPLLKTADLAHMVNDLTGKLPLDRQYTLVGDTGCFDDTYWGSGWMWDDEPDPEAMFLSALAVNGNTVTVTVTPGLTGAAAPVATEPPTSFVVIENSAITGEPGGSCAVSITRPVGERNNRIRVTGSPAPGCPAVSKRLTVWRPELYTLTLLAELLAKAGTPVKTLSMGDAPAGAVRLASTRHSLAEIITLMLKTSDNLSAENLLKYLAHAQSGRKGTAVDGAAAIKEYLRLQGISSEQLVIADGSGLSRYNLTSADTIVRLLTAVYKDKAIFPVFASALPLAGIDGKLAQRLKGSAAEGKVLAKTGSMKGLSSLAGYTVTAAGEPLAFAMIMQNFIGPVDRIHELQDRLTILLDAYSAAVSGQ